MPGESFQTTRLFPHMTVLENIMEQSVESLLNRLHQGLNRLKEWGVNADKIAGSSILTPACGMGTMNDGPAERVLTLLSELSKKL